MLRQTETKMTPATRFFAALLLGSLAASFSAQGRASAAVADVTLPLDQGPAAAAALWLLVCGLAVTALSLLVR